MKFRLRAFMSCLFRARRPGDHLLFRAVLASMLALCCILGFRRLFAADAAGDSAYAAPASATTPAAPVVGDRPGPDNTGPTNPGILVTKSGWTVTQDGAVIEDVHITGTLFIRADNVTVRNFVIDAGGDGYGIECNQGTAGLVIEDGEIHNMASAAVYGAGFTARRLNVHHSNGDGFKPHNGDVTIEDSWIHHLGMGDGAHADGVQATTTSGNRANFVFRGNFFDMPKGPGGNSYVEGGVTYRSNACIYLQAINFGGTIRSVIEGNWLNGGNYTVDLGGGDIGATITNNRFGRNYNFGILDDGGDPGVTQWADNLWADTGAVISK